MLRQRRIKRCWEKKIEVQKGKKVDENVIK